METHLLLGQLYGLNHDSAKAEAQFKLAQGIDANSEEVALNMARLYSEQGDPKRAADVLNAIPVDDRSPRIEFALGASYEQLKKNKDAIAAYHRALDLEPDNLDTERGLANALLADGQLDEALKVLTGIVAAEPQDAQSQIHISEIQRRQGHYDEALKTLEKAKTAGSGLARTDLQRSAHLRLAGPLRRCDRRADQAGVGHRARGRKVLGWRKDEPLDLPRSSGHHLSRREQDR